MLMGRYRDSPLAASVPIIGVREICDEFADRENPTFGERIPQTGDLGFSTWLTAQAGELLSDPLLTTGLALANKDCGGVSGNFCQSLLADEDERSLVQVLLLLNYEVQAAMPRKRPLTGPLNLSLAFVK